VHKKILDEKSSPYPLKNCSLSFISHKMAWAAFRGERLVHYNPFLFSHAPRAKGQGELTPSLPRGKNPEIGNLSIFRILTSNLVSKVFF
jgi:hypothetical protein